MTEPIDQDTLKKITNHLDSHCPNLRCAACGKQNWNAAVLAASIMVPTPVRGEIKFPVPPEQFTTVPLVHVFCGECGCAVSFAATVMDILSPK